MKNILVIGGYPPSLINFRKELLSSLVSKSHNVIACAGGRDKKTILELKKLKVHTEQVVKYQVGLINVENTRAIYRLSIELDNSTLLWYLFPYLFPSIFLSNFYKEYPVLWI